MLKISSTQLWVHDQEVALKYWTEKVGMEVRQDSSLPELGDFRWLTVGPPGQDDVSIVLMAVPGPPVMDEATRRYGLPHPMPYGIDSGFRDPSGNSIRLTQLAEVSA
jgi:hypothetical protein